MKIRLLGFIITISRDRAWAILRECKRQGRGFSKIYRIKAARTLWGLGLTEAKELIESLF